MKYSIDSISAVVEKYVKDQILAARLKSGEKIVEKEIADTLQISRAPVREALGKLSQQGLVIFSPRRGHTVLELPREGILEVFQIRISLELQVLRILVSTRALNGEDYETLGALADQMEKVPQNGEAGSEHIFQLNGLDIEFHRYLWKASKSVQRAQLLEGLFFQLLIVMNQDVRSFGSSEEKAREHRALIEALRTNNAARVCKEFHNHLDKYITATLGSLSQAEKQSLETIFAG